MSDTLRAGAQVDLKGEECAALFGLTAEQWRERFPPQEAPAKPLRILSVDYENKTVTIG